MGGIASGEEGQGFMQLRIKRHRWFPKVLKNRDPLVFRCAPTLHGQAFAGCWMRDDLPTLASATPADCPDSCSPCSIGWRRFQSLPVFSIKDNNERLRMLKYR